MIDTNPFANSFFNYSSKLDQTTHFSGNCGIKLLIVSGEEFASACHSTAIAIAISLYYSSWHLVAPCSVMVV